MKKIVLSLIPFIVISAVVSIIVWSADNTYMPTGTYNDVFAPFEQVITVSSYTVTITTPVINGCQRYYQNTGSNKINYFYVITSSNTTGNKYLPSGQTFIEDKWLGTIYFKSEAGTNNTLAITTFKNK